MVTDNRGRLHEPKGIPTGGRYASGGNGHGVTDDLPVVPAWDGSDGGAVAESLRNQVHAVTARFAAAHPELGERGFKAVRELDDWLRDADIAYGDEDSDNRMLVSVCGQGTPMIEDTIRESFDGINIHVRDKEALKAAHHERAVALNKAMAANTTDWGVIAGQLRHEDPTVRAAAAGNPAIRPEDMDHASADRNPMVREAVYGNPIRRELYAQTVGTVDTLIDRPGRIPKADLKNLDGETAHLIGLVRKARRASLRDQRELEDELIAWAKVERPLSDSEFEAISHCTPALYSLAKREDLDGERVRTLLSHSNQEPPIGRWLASGKKMSDSGWRQVAESATPEMSADLAKNPDYPHAQRLAEDWCAQVEKANAGNSVEPRPWRPRTGQLLAQRSDIGGRTLARVRECNKVWSEYARRENERNKIMDREARTRFHPDPDYAPQYM